MNSKSKSLKSLVLKGSAWTVFGVAAGQVLRLGKSLILSRLLFPEAYGVMAIVWAVLYTLDLLSDVGVAPAIVRSAYGDRESFLNTAWTLKTIRGGLLFLISCAIAYPVAHFYGQPDLAIFIPIAGLTTLIEGFCSTKIYSCQRNMVYGPTTILDISTEVIGLISTLTWAYLNPSVWALLGGAIIGRVFHVISSHIILPGPRNKFQWDREALHELIHFGKWIFLSSLVFLLYSQGDRMILGKYFDARLLGIYGVAILLSEAVTGVVTRLNDYVVYPALSRVVNNDRARLQSVLYRARLGTDAAMLLPIAILMLIGNELVGFLYDSRYHEAGWMLQILCIRLMMMSILVGNASCLMALGNSRFALIQNILRTAWLLIGITIIWPIYGVHGVVWVVSLTEVPVLIVLWWTLYQYKILLLKREILSGVFIAVGSLIGWGILQLIESRR